MVASVIAIVSYILGSLGFYTIANRRGIQHAWLAWVPVANFWLIGCISDQYQWVRFHKRTYKRTILLVLGILQAVAIVVLVVLAIVLVVQMMAAGGGYDPDMLDQPMYETEMGVEDLTPEIMGAMLGMLAAYVVLLLTSLPLLIIQYIALYDVFRSCDSTSSTLYLLLSIFLGISAFLVFAVRDKDYGMPPRQVAQPVAQVAPPVYTEPVQEPWNNNP